MLNRMTRYQAMQYIGCKDNKMRQLERGGLLDGTFFTIGNRKYYITEKLEQWLLEGGEAAAKARMEAGEAS